MEEQSKGSGPSCPSCIRAAKTANIARCLSQRTNARLNRFLRTLGARGRPLSMDEDDMRTMENALHRMLRRDLSVLSVKELEMWAERFLALDCNYLVLTEHLFGRTDPWYFWVELSERIMTEAPVTNFLGRKDLEACYGYLDMGRKNIAMQAYMFCHRYKGGKEALRRFPGYGIRRPSVTNIIVGLLYP